MDACGLRVRVGGGGGVGGPGFLVFGADAVGTNDALRTEDHAWGPGCTDLDPGMHPAVWDAPEKEAPSGLACSRVVVTARDGHQHVAFRDRVTLTIRWF